MTTDLSRNVCSVLPSVPPVDTQLQSRMTELMIALEETVSPATPSLHSAVVLAPAPAGPPVVLETVPAGMDLRLDVTMDVVVDEFEGQCDDDAKKKNGKRRRRKRGDTTEGGAAPISTATSVRDAALESAGSSSTTAPRMKLLRECSAANPGRSNSFSHVITKGTTPPVIHAYESQSSIDDNCQSTSSILINPFFTPDRSTTETVSCISEPSLDTTRRPLYPPSIPVPNTNGPFNSAVASVSAVPSRRTLPTESDSFTDTLPTVVGHAPRRKRLVKRTVPPTGEFGHPGDPSGFRSRSVSRTIADVASPVNYQALRRMKRLTVCQREHSGSLERMDDDASAMSSCLSSSDSELHAGSGDGIDADDEQSDWFLEPPFHAHEHDSCAAERTSSPPGEYMGIAPVDWHARLVNKSRGRGRLVSHPHPVDDVVPADDESSRTPAASSTATATPTGSNHQFRHSSDTDMSLLNAPGEGSAVLAPDGASQSSHPPTAATTPRPYPPLHRTRRSSLLGFVHVLAERVKLFIEDAQRCELELGHLRKKHRREVLKLSVLYRLHVRYEVRRRRRIMFLCKPKRR